MRPVIVKISMPLTNPAIKDFDFSDITLLVYFSIYDTMLDSPQHFAITYEEYIAVIEKRLNCGDSAYAKGRVELCGEREHERTYTWCDILTKEAKAKVNAKYLECCEKAGYPAKEQE